MNISSNGKLLASATKDLSVRWSETTDAWKDTKAREFELRYLAELMASVDRAVPLRHERALEHDLVERVTTDADRRLVEPVGSARSLLIFDFDDDVLRHGVLVSASSRRART